MKEKLTKIIGASPKNIRPSNIFPHKLTNHNSIIDTSIRSTTKLESILAIDNITSLD